MFDATPLHDVSSEPGARAVWLDALGFGLSVTPDGRTLTRVGAERLATVLDCAHALPEPARAFELRLIFMALGEAASGALGLADGERVADAWEAQARGAWEAALDEWEATLDAGATPAERHEAGQCVARLLAERYAMGAALRASALQS